MNNQNKDSVKEISPSKLLLDNKNPRLPEGISEEDQPKLIEFVANEYDSIAIARSIAYHGFFLSEPLIGIETNKEEYIIVEGNRRLAALKLLEDDRLRAELDLTDDDEWDDLAEKAELPETIPVIIVSDRRSVAPIIGYRHILGIEPWDPWAKARFIASLIEGENLKFTDVANEVGENENDIKGHYRNYRIIYEGREKHNIDTKRAEKRFGVFTRAMSSLPLREHIGAPSPSDVKKEEIIIRKKKADELQELLSWLFGTEEQKPVIQESRDISTLGNVVKSEEGLRVLREARNLGEAFIAAGGLKERLLRRLNVASSHLEAAECDLHEYYDDEKVVTLLERCKKALDRLLSILSWNKDKNNAVEHD